MNQPPKQQAKDYQMNHPHFFFQKNFRWIFNKLYSVNGFESLTRGDSGLKRMIKVKLGRDRHVFFCFLFFCGDGPQTSHKHTHTIPPIIICIKLKKLEKIEFDIP